MKRFIQTAFVICFITVLIIPIVCFNKNGAISEVENRNLATRPYIFIENRLNKNLFSEYSAYFDDRFGGRSHLITLNHKINNTLNRDSFLHNNRALQGKNGWWFYISVGDGDNLSDFYKRNVMNEESLNIWKQNIKNVSDWCEQQGIKAIFLICPNKHSIYSENYPFSRPKGLTRSDQFIKIFEELGISYVYPRDFLIQKKGEFDYPFYCETDTHWNSAGAYIAFTKLKEKIELAFPNVDFPNIEYDTTIDYNMTKGDILPMLGVPESKSTQISMTPRNHSNTDFYSYVKNEGTNGILTKGTNNNLPKALIFRDSFFSALEPFTSPLFSEAEYKWKQFRDEDKDYILEYKPDIIIFECVERYSPTFVICE